MTHEGMHRENSDAPRGRNDERIFAQGVPSEEMPDPDLDRLEQELAELDTQIAPLRKSLSEGDWSVEDTLTPLLDRRGELAEAIDLKKKRVVN